MEDKVIKKPLNTKILCHRKSWMCRLPRSWKRFWGRISVCHPTPVHAFALTFVITQCWWRWWSHINLWPEFYRPGQGLSQGCPLAQQWLVGFGRRWPCHSPGSEGCWVLIFVEERHHKNLWRIWFHFQSNLNTAQQIQPGTTHRDSESNSSFSPFKAKASWEKHFLKLDPATL